MGHETRAVSFPVGVEDDPAAMTANVGRKYMRDRYLGLLMTVALAVAAVDAVTSLAMAQAPQIVRPPARI